MSSSLFGALVSWNPVDGSHVNGLRKANEAFILAVIRYSRFDQLHLFFLPEHITRFKEDNSVWLKQYGADKVISLVSVNELPEYLSSHQYTAFHQGDHHIANLAELRNQFSSTPFPITGRAHSLSDDPSLSRTRELVLAPLRSCDAILCSSSAQKKVMAKLLTAASSSLSDSVGMAIPYSGQVLKLPLGITAEPEQGSFGGMASAAMKAELKKSLGLQSDKPVILCLGRLTAADKADLKPLLIALNNLLESGTTEFQLVIAGASMSGSEEMSILTTLSYELNLEDRIRFELSVDEQRKQMLLSAADVFVTLSDNIQESFGLAILEAMKAGLAVVASDWNGHRDLIEHGRSGFLVETQAFESEPLSRPLSLFNKRLANFVEAQSTAVNIEQLTTVLAELITDLPLRETLGVAAQSRVKALFDWPVIMDQYHELVEDLNQKAGGERLQHRRSGTPYQEAFGHYPSLWLNSESWLKTTDRGLRVYLESEKDRTYRQLQFLIDRELVRVVLSKAIAGVKVTELLALMLDERQAGFVLGWMVKHYLLKTVSARAERGLPYQPDFSAEPDDAGISYPESGRAHLLKPIVGQFTHSFRSLMKKPVVCEQSLVQQFANHIDERLLQALCWYGEEHQLNNYHDILNAVTSKGGLSALVKRYPFAVRGARRQFVRELKVSRRLISRFERHLIAINKQFFNDDQQAVCISQVESLFNEQAGRVYGLTLDNGHKLVYKERNLEVDAILTGSQGLMASLAGWLDGYPCPETHEILPLQDEQGPFGFTEYVSSNIETELSDDYQKSLGVLLGFCLMTGQGDVHHLNVLIKEGLPCLIDAEAPFHTPVLMSLVNDINHPEAGFVRGLGETALGHTGLLDIWESFHTYTESLCSHKLTDGHLEERQPQEYQPVVHHFLTAEGRHSFDGQQPSLVSCCEPHVVEGFKKAIQVIVGNASEWCRRLKLLSTQEISYKPELERTAIRKQLRFSFVERAFQSLPFSEACLYFRRISARIAGAAEINQRWLDASWQEPSSLLSESLYRSLMSQQNFYFTRTPNGSGCSGVTESGKAWQITDSFFSLNPCDVLTDEIAALAADDQLLEQLLTNYEAALGNWLKHQCQPGRHLAPEMKQQVVNEVSIKSKTTGR